jgi:hypothetical protein
MLPRIIQVKLACYLAVGVLALPTSAHAVGSSGVNLKILAQLQQMYTQFQKTLETAQKTKRRMEDLKELQKLENMSREDIRSGKAFSAISEAAGAGEGVFYENTDALQNVGQLRSQIEGITAQLNQTDEGPKKERLEALLDLRKRELSIARLRDATNETVKDSGGSLSNKEAQQMTAQNTALLARSAAAERQRAVDQDKQDAAARSRQKQAVSGVDKAYEAMGSRGRFLRD